MWLIIAQIMIKWKIVLLVKRDIYFTLFSTYVFHKFTVWSHRALSAKMVLFLLIRIVFLKIAMFLWKMPNVLLV